MSASVYAQRDSSAQIYEGCQTGIVAIQGTNEQRPTQSQC
jgi:hypothetical protein